MGRTRPVRAVLLPVLVGAAMGCGQGNEPVQQPIAYPHDIHAGQNEIPCLYCHTGAQYSVDATIPALEVCAGCHFPGGVPLVGADKPEVQKLLSYWRAGEPIPWVRIHKLPDHVHFPHNMHVNADIQCQDCHGPVQEFTVMYQYSSLRMGWCLQCHREKNVRTDCSVCHY